MRAVRDNDELMMITQNGMVVRTAVSELRTIGRATQGVRMIALRPGDRLVDIAHVVADDVKEPELGLEAKTQAELGLDVPPEGDGGEGK